MVCGGGGYWWVDFGLGFTVVTRGWVSGFWFLVVDGGWVWFMVMVASGGLILGWGLWWCQVRWVGEWVLIYGG